MIGFFVYRRPIMGAERGNRVRADFSFSLDRWSCRCKAGLGLPALGRVPVGGRSYLTQECI